MNGTRSRAVAMDAAVSTPATTTAAPTRAAANSSPRLRSSLAPTAVVGFQDAALSDHLRERSLAYSFYFREKRHFSHPESPRAVKREPWLAAQRPPRNLANTLEGTGDDGEWRIRERMKTVSVALVLCLNIGVDPPDVIKTSPCAKLECWIDPFSLPPQKALEAIGKNLQAQYEVWQPRARYKQSLDPTAEETKKLCCALRRNAKEERVLFHYNGHGVPKPTASGELWVFNKNYTQYIPISIYDVQSWIGAPAIYVYDCSAAGNLLVAFKKFAAQRDRDQEQRRSLGASTGAGTDGPSGEQQQQQHLEQHELNLDAAAGSTQQAADTPAPVGPVGGPLPLHQIPMSECIQLAACAANQILPMHPDLPADLFTACLTTPIEIALRWFLSQSPLLSEKVTSDLISKIPGRLNDRRTPLGELNWIFTAITDTIAWNMLPRDLFKKLFRQDLMVAALFRNFLLAERILRTYQCTPLSSPALPATHQHPLWNAWDLAADMCLAQLPAILDPEHPAPYHSSTFFTEQLTAFEVWLERAKFSRRPPEQLPIVLQVLLSQAHRLRALVLLGKFLDLGPWAVHQALAVGIFPYVLKLLQSPAVELKLILVFIWARILAVDSSCQNDLLKDNGYQYFVNILLASSNLTNAVPDLTNLSELRAMCAFILSVFCDRFRNGQVACLRSNVLAACVEHLVDRDPLLRQWTCICLGQLWADFPEAKELAVRGAVQEKLYPLLADGVPEVRAATVFALHRLIGVLELTPLVPGENPPVEQYMGVHIIALIADASPLVRKEVALALGSLVRMYQGRFVDAALEYLDAEKRGNRQNSQTVRSSLSSRPSSSTITPIDRLFRTNLAHHSFYECTWKVLLNLSMDPFTEVARIATIVIDHINYHLLLLPQFSILQKINQQHSQHASLQIPNLAPYQRYATLFHTLFDTPAHMSAQLAAHTSVSLSTGNLERPRSSGAGIISTVSSAAGSKRGSVQPPPAVSAMMSAAQLQQSILSASTAALPASSAANSLLSVYRHSEENLANKRGTHRDRDRKSSSTSAEKVNVTSKSIPPSSSARSSAESLPLRPSREMDVEEDPVYKRSQFFEWSLDFFTEPRLQTSEQEFPGGDTPTRREWRYKRNERCIVESVPQQAAAATGSLKPDRQISLLDIQADSTQRLLFHPFDETIIVGDSKNIISIWKYADGVRRNAFANGNLPGTRITSLNLLNSSDVGLLLTATDDGTVRVFRDYETSGMQALVSAWRAIPDLIPDETGCGLLTDWQQVSGSLIVAGDSKVIRVWDAERELCSMEIPTGSTTSVSTLTSDKVTTNLLIAGCADGSVRLYDKRNPPGESLVMSFVEHEDWVANVHLQVGADRRLVSACTKGDVRFWDSRFSRSVKTIQAESGGGLTSMAMHDYCPLFSTGSESQQIKTFHTDGRLLSTIRYHEGFLGQRIAPVHQVVYHPYQVMMAAGGTDQIVSIFTASSTSGAATTVVGV